MISWKKSVYIFSSYLSDVILFSYTFDRGNVKDSFRKIFNIQGQTISFESTKNPLNMDKQILAIKQVNASKSFRSRKSRTIFCYT